MLLELVVVKGLAMQCTVMEYAMLQVRKLVYDLNRSITAYPIEMHWMSKCTGCVADLVLVPLLLNVAQLHICRAQPNATLSPCNA